MQSITPLRLLVLIPLIWISPLIFWCFLPFPQIPQATRIETIQDTLGAGETLPLVLHPEELYGISPPGFEHNGGGIKIDWQLTTASSPRGLSVQLKLGSIAIDLFEILGNPENEDVLFVTDVEQGSRADDKIIVMPWFPWVDATLFDIDVPRIEPIALKIHADELRSVEIWGTNDLKNEERTKYGLEPVWPILDPQTARIASISNIPSECTTPTCIKDVVVRLPKGELLSRTFVLRNWILHHFETQIYINLYIILLFCHPLEMLGYHMAFLIPLMIGYFILGFLLYRFSRRVRATFWRSFESDMKSEQV